MTGAALMVQNATGNGSASSVGVQWIEKSYHIRAPSDAWSCIRIVIGVWETWETPRTCCLDREQLLFSRAN
jgi:hypothetical protein